MDESNQPLQLALAATQLNSKVLLCVEAQIDNLVSDPFDEHFVAALKGLNTTNGSMRGSRKTPSNLRLNFSENGPHNGSLDTCSDEW